MNTASAHDILLCTAGPKTQSSDCRELIWHKQALLYDASFKSLKQTVKKLRLGNEFATKVLNTIIKPK